MTSFFFFRAPDYYSLIGVTRHRKQGKKNPKNKNNVIHFPYKKKK